MPRDWRDKGGLPVDFGCGFTEIWFGASESDAICVEGYLQDINHPRPNWDSRLYPCPYCNTEVYLYSEYDEYCRSLYTEKVTGRRFQNFDPDAYWDHAKRTALETNPDAARPVIATIEKKRPLDEGG